LQKAIEFLKAVDFRNRPKRTVLDVWRSDLKLIAAGITGSRTTAAGEFLADPRVEAKVFW
jgi:hypothetical protein